MSLLNMTNTPESRLSYRDAHSGEHPFPLNGTDWAREVALHLDREFHHRDADPERNLLTRLHSLNSPFQHENSTVARAIAYWFLHDPRLAHLKPIFHTDETTIEHAVRTLHELTPTAVTLADAEASWLRQRQKAWSPLAGKHWVPDTTEEYEGHPESRGDILAIAANKMSSDTTREEPPLQATVSTFDQSLNVSGGTGI